MLRLQNTIQAFGNEQRCDAFEHKCWFKTNDRLLNQILYIYTERIYLFSTSKRKQRSRHFTGDFFYMHII